MTGRTLRVFVVAGSAAAVAIPADGASLSALAPAANYTPVACGVGPGSGFDDVPDGHPYCGFIRELSDDGISAGCGSRLFCPDDPVTRGQLAMFLERTMRGAATWDAWRDGPISPSGIDWGGLTGTPNVGTMMEYTLAGAADDDSGIYFDTESVILWSPGEGGLLRIFDEDAADAAVDLTQAEVYNFGNSTLSFRRGGANGNFTLGFLDGGLADDEYIRWNDGDDAFDLSNDLNLPPGGFLYFGTVGGGFPYLAWNAGQNRFELSRSLAAGIYEGDDSLFLIFDSNADSTTEVLAVFAEDNSVSNKVADIAEDGDMRIRGTLATGVGFDVAEAFLRAERLEPGDVVRADPLRRIAALRARSGDGASILGVVSTRAGATLGGAVFDVDSLSAWGDDVRADYESQRRSLQVALLSEHAGLRDRASALARRRASATPGSVEAASLAAEASRWEDEIESLALQRFIDARTAPIALAGRVPVKADASAGAIRVGDPLTAGPVPGVAVRLNGPGMAVGTALEPLAEGRGKVLMFVDRGWWGGAAPASDTPADVPRAIPAAAEPSGPQPRGSIRDFVDETLMARGSGHAEMLAVSDAVEVGEVLAVDAQGRIRPSELAEDTGVVGVASWRPGVLAGGRAAPGVPVVVAGVARVKVDAGYGAISPGDLLVSSPTRGHAMRADRPAVGSVVGKALEGLEDGTGAIRVLVTLR